MNDRTDVLILVGGKGTRLRKVVNDRPKPMAIVAGRPFLEWLLLMLRSQGISRVVLCTGYMGQVIETYFGNGNKIGMDIVYAYESVPLGTAGAIRNALNKTNSERLLVMNGDSYCGLDIDHFRQEHLRVGARVSLWTVTVDDCSRYGAVEISGKNAVLAFREKTQNKQSGLINAGIYLFEREVIAAIPLGQIVSLETQVFPSLIGQGLYAVAGGKSFIDIGTPESYDEAQLFFREKLI